MSVPKDLLYTQSHEWARVEGDVITVGITHYAQTELGEVVYVELPEVGDAVETGGEIGTLESVKAVSEINCPVSGEVLEVNSDLEDSPNLVNEGPYTEGWLIKIKGGVEGSELMDASAYSAFLEAESH